MTETSSTGTGAGPLPYCLDLFDTAVVSWNPQSHLHREWHASLEAAEAGRAAVATLPGPAKRASTRSRSAPLRRLGVMQFAGTCKAERAPDGA